MRQPSALLFGRDMPRNICVCRFVSLLLSTICREICGVILYFDDNGQVALLQYGVNTVENVFINEITNPF
jgi:hypothetical protein